jgi:hypothetical protein
MLRLILLSGLLLIPVYAQSQLALGTPAGGVMTNMTGLPGGTPANSMLQKMYHSLDRELEFFKLGMALQMLTVRCWPPT